MRGGRGGGGSETVFLRNNFTVVNIFKVTITLTVKYI